MKKLQKAFEALKFMVEEGLDHVQKEVLPIIHGAGLLSLPIEILGRIFKEITATHSTLPFQMTCRSLRECAIKMLEPWTKISTEMNPIHFLRRSRSCKLDIEICKSICRRKDHSRRTGDRAEARRAQEIDTSRAENFLMLLKSHTSRWESFIFRNRADEVHLMALLADQSFPNFFPLLRHVQLMASAGMTLLRAFAQSSSLLLVRRHPWRGLQADASSDRVVDRGLLGLLYIPRPSSAPWSVENGLAMPDSL